MGVYVSGWVHGVYEGMRECLSGCVSLCDSYTLTIAKRCGGDRSPNPEKRTSLMPRNARSNWSVS